MSRPDRALGICIGSATLTAVTVHRDGGGAVRVGEIFSRNHHGDPREALAALLASLDQNDLGAVAVTGRKFRHLVNVTSISEAEAVERALFHVNGRYPGLQAVVSAGSETFLLYRLGPDGRITAVYGGGKCASGTGDFFLQQIRRIGLGLEEAVRLARSQEPYQVSGRCSVFCKSDCTHATNKGVPRERVAAGLCLMMAGKVLELVRKAAAESVMIVGGCAKNEVMIDHLKKEIPRVTVPEEASHFEALGCALWALDNGRENKGIPSRLFREREASFPRLPPLGEAEAMVEFRASRRGQAREGDRCVLGLDVGSTTTKAVLVREEDDLIVASVYLRTEGDPVGASRACYRGLMDQLGETAHRIRITGLGVTGSGRQIAGFHAMTDGIVNEIIAHATGALHFDPEVDTIFEIGGQDAKYTFIVNGVPSDYAMNEACSAGTGSFLEEAAKETLDIPMEEIAPVALKAQSPPNFNDQCAAFIGSDIKNAFLEGIPREDIVAGLVYSICANYISRVKGNRAVGRKVFMQGGVCYNRAVPLAMAALTGKRIVVPPDAGLMGAFGVALEVKNRRRLGLLEERSFSLAELAAREIEYGPTFICKGGGEGCDRRCEIARLRIDGKTYPFGGACNRWYNARSRLRIDTEPLNHVGRYERAVFKREGSVSPGRPRIGINKSFFTNAYFPLYRTFFTDLGFEVVLPGTPRPEGARLTNSELCFPAEIAHAYLYDLLEGGPDFLFLPQVTGDFVENVPEAGVTCPLSQGEPFYLRTAFKDHETFRRLEARGRVLSPPVDFSRGPAAARETFLDLAARLGVDRPRAREAYERAVAAQEEVRRLVAESGREVLDRLEEDPGAFAVVVFGRPYNAFVSEAHKGIPNKFASRGIPVIPLTALPLDGDCPKENMYWSAGQRILKAAEFVRSHPRLFACYVTNFSCGPDSFLITYFRDLMGRKPSLTLELDSHVADAGLETRIEAFIDIVRRHLQLGGKGPARTTAPFRPARVERSRGGWDYVDSAGRRLSLKDPRVKVLLPSMGRFLSEAGAACLRRLGMNAAALPPAGEETLKTGRGHTSCKECLPMIVTVGGLLEYVEGQRKGDEKLVYFMPTASGPCRFGQYSVFLSDLVRGLGIPDVAVLSPTAEDSYSSFGGAGAELALWNGACVASLFEEIHSLLLTNAVRPTEALAVFEEEWRRALTILATTSRMRETAAGLREIARRLAAVPVRRRRDETPLVLVTGEIFVRHDGISRRYLVEELAARGFAAKVSSLLEWVYYTDYCVMAGLARGDVGALDRLSLLLRNRVMRRRERLLRRALGESGLVGDLAEDVEDTIRHGRRFINPVLTCEAILTVGAVLREVADHCCGAIAIGPFGCMPNRLAEAVLSRRATLEEKAAAGGGAPRPSLASEGIRDLPFLAIESDGNRFPQIITAKLEAFLLQAARLHEAMARRGH